MPKFEVEVKRRWTQFGSVTVEADSLADAKDIVEGFTFDEEDQIEWDPPEVETDSQLRATWAMEVP